ncbi:hypothetical protein Mgra_00007012 [Meloidogyne graminicola]|uniref:Uncharacterized protein n=1 Tax=Meloidogyne graminicola TaxID=189291 RepID=A0A8S9ZKD1_9BILA|nr:hypothetical protein Mgra_00007012 [Meloidogyne graminicola]
MLLYFIVFISVFQVYANEDLSWWSPEKCIYKYKADLVCKSARGCCGEINDTTKPCPQHMYWGALICCRPFNNCEKPSPNNFVCSHLHSILTIGSVCSTSCIQSPSQRTTSPT